MTQLRNILSPNTLRSLTRVGCAVLLALTFGLVGSTTPIQALGPLIAITPNEIDTGGATPVANPTLSGRGEDAGVWVSELNANGWANLDVPGAEPLVDRPGYGIAVSGDGCSAIRARPGPAATVATVVFVFTNTCIGVDQQVFGPIFSYNSNGQIALSFDGRFAAIFVGFGEGTSTVYRVDTTTGEAIPMPLTSNSLAAISTAGIDISDNGNVVVATYYHNDFEFGTYDVFAWDVPSGAFDPVGPTSIDGGSGWPTISGDGRYVTFTSSRALTGAEAGFGPWVYVADRANPGSFVLVSPAGASGFHSSISRDGSQVAFVTTPTCTSGDYDRFYLADIANYCQGQRLDVAFGPAPGLTAGFTTEAISVAANGTPVQGRHFQPAISGNGRWVAWLTDNARPMGVPVAGLQAVMRRRDPGVTVDPLDFGTIAANTSLVLATTVRNTGRTSVSLDSITASPGQFAIQGGGTCVGGSLLPPGATCTVNIRFSAPGAVGTTNGAITVAEAGYDPISAAAPLIGRSSTTTTQPGTTTTTIFVDGGTPTTTRPPRVTTTTTTPGNVSLQADPAPLDFGQVPFGISSPIKTLTVTNTGTTAGTILTELAGTNPTDFFVAVNNCNETTLAPGASCTMDIMMIAQAGGNRSAELILTAGGASGSVDLLGQARFLPRLLATPGAITTNGLTTIVGQGFPPGQTFTVNIGGTDQTLTGTADTTGLFRIPYSAFNKLELGSYQLTVDALPDIFDLVRGQLVVVLPTFQPQGPGGPVFGGLIFGDTLIVTRG